MSVGTTLRFDTRPDRTEYRLDDHPLEVGDGLTRNGEDRTVVEATEEKDGSTTVFLHPASTSE